jgi:hypothetical protein
MQAAGALQVWQTAENMVLGGVVLPAVFNNLHHLVSQWLKQANKAVLV